MPKILNDITEADLVEITKLSALFFTPREIAIMLEFVIEDFIDICGIEGNKYFNSFYSGRLQSEIDLRTATIKLAKAGSSPAATMAMDLIKLSKIKMLDR